MVVRVSEVQRIPTSGARAVEVFSLDGLELLAIPQLAVDVPDTEPGMNAGDSNTDLLVFVREDGHYVPSVAIPAPGGEDAEFFSIGARSFLAVASIRSGSGPYEYSTKSTIQEWTAGSFTEFQSIETYAAKQWKHWQIGERHFLAIAQGLELSHIPGPNRDSMIYEWDGSGFVEFQQIASKWAYNWHPFWVDDSFFVAHADHLEPSILYRWDGERFVEHQELRTHAGRAFASFERDGHHHLVVVGLAEPPVVMRWDETRFVPYQGLDGLGAREICVVEHDGRLFVIRVNFILGTPHDPEPELISQVYEWRDEALHVAAEFPTCGATDVDIVAVGSDIEFVVSNSLSPLVRFATDTIVYAMSTTGSNT